MSIGRVHSGCRDPIQVTVRLVIVLVSRIQKNDAGGNGPIHLLSNRNFGQNGKRVKPPLVSFAYQPSYNNFVLAQTAAGFVIG